jgi:hypothetical protein
MMIRHELTSPPGMKGRRSCSTIPTLKTFLVLVVFLSLSLSAHAGSATFSGIEQMSGWKSCTACAGGGESAVYWKKLPVYTPSLDGKSTQYFVGGSVPFSHGLWWRWMSGDGAASRFTFSMSYYMKNPAASQGLEFAANQALGGKWYKFSTQCSFSSKMWRVWDSYYRRWRDTGIACTRPSAYKWTNVVFEYARQDGKAKFLSITVNGTKHYVNKSFSPQPNVSGTSIGIHFQLNGNQYQNDYSVWADKMQLKYY